MGALAVDACFDHVVDVYAHEASMIERVSRFLYDALSSGGAALVVASADHRWQLDAALGHNLPLGQLRAAGLLVELDAADTLARISIPDRPNRAAFRRVLEPLIFGLAERGRPVRAYGEMVALLWAAGRIREALDLETYWNDLGAEKPFSLYCSYPTATAGSAEQADELELVCGLHSEVRGLGAGPDSNSSWTSFAERTFDASAEAPAAARSLVRLVMDQLGRDPDHVTASDAEIIVSELVSNAVRHARSRHRVGISARQDRIRIVVEDLDRTLPYSSPVIRERPSGRGLAFVEAISDRWGYLRTDTGKAMWAELRLSADA